MTSLAIVILTYNEEKHIVRAIQAVRSLAHELFVVDSFSTDRTIELARNAGAIVLQNKFVNYGKQFQWALENAPITSDWVMRLDADEVVEPELAFEIQHKLPQLGHEIAGINLNCKHIFMGKWIRYGGRYPLVLLRIWRRGMARIEDRWMDEHMVLSQGATVTFSGNFANHDLNDLSFFTEKHNKYATREAVDIINRRHGLFPTDTLSLDSSSSFQAISKRLVKEKIYNRIPFYIAAPTYFCYRFFFQLGFLDGKVGVIYHVLHALWYRFLVGAKVVEFERALITASERKEKLDVLARLTGLSLTNLSASKE